MEWNGEVSGGSVTVNCLGGIIIQMTLKKILFIG